MKTTPSNPFSGVVRLVLVIALLVVTGGAAWAQVAAPVYKVGSLDLKFVGAANVNEQVVRANMQVREGIDLDDSLIDQDIRSLYKTGLFEFIEVKRDVRPDRIVNLVFELTPKFRVLSVRYDGNVKVKSRRLDKEIKTKPNSALDERQVKEDVTKIREYYQKSGYNQVQVSYNIERNRATGFGNVIFKISEGAKVKISRVNFVGNEHAKKGKLRKVMETKKWNIFSWITGSGRFKDDQFQDDLDKLRDYYRELGYLDVEVPSDKVEYKYPSSRKLVLTIHINEGRQYKVGEISITGNTIIETEKLRAALKQITGTIFAPSLIDKDVTALEDSYGKDGYIETRVQLVRKPNLATGAIDIEYRIKESDKFYVESIRVEGNTKTKSIVILRELALGPGEVFDSVRMKTSKQRLDNTRFFEEVNTTPETTSIPGRKNLKIAVREGRTGNLTFGAGFSSLERAVVFAELTQSNFDLFNRRSMFQGDGQKFRLRLQVGSRSSEAILSFEEPWLFEQQLALGFTIFRSESDYNSSFYSEIRTGAEVYLRKRLFELVEGRLSYGYEIVDIQDVTPGYTVVYPEETTALSKVGFQLLRDTRDKLVNTTRGNRIELTTELTSSSLGGDADYYRLEAKGSQFFQLFETQNQVVSFIGRTGVLNSFGDTAQVPFYDRFYLGGPYTLRGFEYRDVGPKVSVAGDNVPVGGNTYGFLSIEYSLDIVEPLRFAFFYDAGFVNSGSYEFSPSQYNDNFGFGLRLLIAGAPLSLDYGIPITTDKVNDQGGQFNFSFGTRF
ncbi:outer membrane protein assembly factor BamA [Rariglobus hedericola]|uniref:Outer membrane protein assembly factor BamA n=1 Tax=Rariglobus hedericola TaxID=2597822 RepID=A0A556QLC1_9BACT|nr:outer membrane protein assembly factor BamA [Rariglobus hedericola]